MHIFKYEKKIQEKRISRLLLDKMTVRMKKLEDKLNSKVHIILIF